jgi:1-acyl-sn-glycerol-3-phosphate acyltransferase
VNSSNSEYPSPFVFESLRYLALFISKILWRIEFHGTENIPQNLKGGLLIAPNHQTYIDPVWVTLPVKRKFRYLAWDELFKRFLIGKLIRYLGAFPVKTVRYSTSGRFDAMRKALRYLREGATLVVFPEGEREFADGKLLPFRTGAVRIAMEAGVPILPVTVRGGNKVWSQGMKYPGFGKVEIIYHPLIQIPKPAKKKDLHTHLDKMTEKLAEIIKGGNATVTKRVK